LTEQKQPAGHGDDHQWALAKRVDSMADFDGNKDTDSVRLWINAADPLQLKTR
jgi:hypothetical protein